MSSKNNNLPSEYSKLASAIKGKSAWVNIIKDAVWLDHARFPLDDIMKKISLELKGGRVGSAMAFARIAGYKDFSKFIRETRRYGILRASKYEFETKHIRNFISSLLIDDGIFKILPVDREYLLSIQNILHLADQIRSIRLAMIRQLRPESHKVLKTLLVKVDRAFWPISDEQLEEYYKNNAIDAAPDQQSVENTASAFSALTAILGKSFRMTDKDTTWIDVDSIKSGRVNKQLQLGGLFSEYQEAEILLDGFPFFATLDGNVVTLESKDPLLEKSIRLGYVQTNLQNVIRNLANPKAMKAGYTLEELARELCDRYRSFFIELKHDPISRYVVKLPLIDQFTDLLKNDDLFFEEIKYLYETAIDSFLTLDDLVQCQVHADINIMDLVKIRRFFSIISFMVSDALQNHPTLFDIDEVDIWSRIPVIEYDHLLNAFRVIFDESKAAKLLDLLVYRIGSNAYFDLQYKPIIRFNKYCMFSLGVLANTNIVRNIICDNSFKMVASNQPDPMQNAVLNAFGKTGFLAGEGLTGFFEGKKIEIDIIVYLNGHLFILECKNSFHPCSPHEMRTSFAHIQKAAGQLTRAKAWLSDRSHQENVFKKMGWPAANVQSVHTLILTANRIFTGFVAEDHPVRHAHELLNVLGSGEIRMDDSYYCLWNGEYFNVEDLIDYLGGDSITSMQVESMIPIEISSDIGKFTLSRKSYVFDMLYMKDMVEKNYRRISKEQYDQNKVAKNFTPVNLSLQSLS